VARYIAFFYKDIQTSVTLIYLRKTKAGTKNEQKDTKRPLKVRVHQRPNMSSSSLECPLAARV
jgi:hypothetical protein